MYTDIRSRQLEGTFPGDPMKGVWPVSAQRISKGWGNVLAGEWPQIHSDAWPGVEPEGVDEKAKALRSNFYQRTRTELEVRVALAYDLPVGVSLEVTKQWACPEMGHIEMPGPQEPVLGSHHVNLLGFNLIERAFIFQNSWGEEWGYRGFGFLPFDYFTQYLIDAWITHFRRPRARYEHSGSRLIRWTEPDILGHSWTGGDKVYCMEHFERDGDESMGWAFLTVRDNHLDVEELFVRPTYRNRGLANEMLADILKLSSGLRLPLRMWVTFADWLADERAVRMVGRKLNLSLCESRKRWAPIIGTPKRQYVPTPST